jgi:hypothetical protein
MAVKGARMRYLRLAGVAGMFLLGASYAHAQRVVIGVGVGVPAARVYYGPPPACAYGYYDYYPYSCAPYGYYGPEWFAGGVFIGAGPWYHAHYRPGYGCYRPGYYRHGFYPRYYSRGYYRRDFDRGYHRGYYRGRWRH